MENSAKETVMDATKDILKDFLHQRRQFKGKKEITLRSGVKDTAKDVMKDAVKDVVLGRLRDGNSEGGCEGCCEG